MNTRRRRGGGGKSLGGKYPHIFADFKKGVYIRDRDRVAFSDLFTLTNGTWGDDGLTIDSATDSLSISGANNGLSSMPAAFSLSLSGYITYTDNDTVLEASFMQWVGDASNLVQIRLKTNGVETGQPWIRHLVGGVVSNVDTGGDNDWDPGTDVPFRVGIRITASEIQCAMELGAGDVAAVTGMPDLSGGALDLCNLGVMTLSQFRLWADDIGEAGLIAI